MRRAATRLLAAVLLAATAATGALAQPAVAAPPVASDPIVLRDTTGQMDIDGLVQVWVDPRSEASVEQVVRNRAAFRRADPQTTYKLGLDGALWMRLRVHRPADQRQDWVLDFPMPALDLVTLFQFERGAWRGESAGDIMAVNKWPEPGRYPSFRLMLEPGETRELYLRIQHTAAANFPVQLSTAARHSQRLQLEYLAIGAAFGALLLLILGCVAKGIVYHDPVFGWYAAYASLTSLAVAAATGTAAHLLWPGFEALKDAPVGMLACAAVAAATLFVRTILALRRRFFLLDRLMLLLALVGTVVSLLPPLLPKNIAQPLVGVYVLCASLVVIAVSAFVWWRGDPVAKWVFAAYVPMEVAVLTTIAQRIFGWVSASPSSQYSVIAAMLVEVPMLLISLFIRSRDRHSAQVREQALSTQDALTGLLAPHLFTDRLRQVVTRHRRDGLSAAVMYIELVNHHRIREYFGNSVADQSLLRSVIKLRRLLRDADTVSRVGDARFGVLLEGAASRASVTERATRLVAAGLMPLPGLKPDVTLQFHVAAVMLNETPMEAEEIEAALRAQLARMSPRTRRPIRFVEAEPAPASDAGDSSLFAALPATVDAHPDGDLATAP
jgi:two-component system, sensor histidine kinase LadS